MPVESLGDQALQLVDGCVSFVFQFIAGWLTIAATTFMIEGTKNSFRRAHHNSKG